ncbi:ChbG/HpnK family deacetylase [Diplocloster modestus]|uniref:ChbG/HpnK family deacetylase n=1 Tax=Diplocloster modestus TaxID=2850322 RepID=A0ABS6K6Q9_9FIRM|nr:ChbG/HpnK family deacetylase [Diplocloster modestus]MBU9726200.1 ChbG/HpnK family deacetylase [Diplocloster modestus]
MKLVIRADDIGYSNVCNIGSFEAIDHGVVTSADIMLDTPGTVDALERLRNYPWLSIGWHTHFWGTPVLGGENVPTLFDPARDGFRTDLDASDISFDEALAECRAQMELCVKILGRAPDVGGSMVSTDTPFGRALAQVHEEYLIVTDYMGTDLGTSQKIYSASDKWVDRKIFVRGLLEYCAPLRAEPLTPAGWTDSITALDRYDPIRFYIEDESHLLEVPEDSITVHAWHPGYVDYYVYRRGDHTPAAYCFKDIRTVDVHALCSPEVKEWLKCNRVELINMRDALYGTNEYQNHLRAIGSELAL